MRPTRLAGVRERGKGAVEEVVHEPNHSPREVRKHDIEGLIRAIGGIALQRGESLESRLPWCR